MSNFIFGRILCNDKTKIASSKIDFSMIELCVNNDFAVHFISTLPTKDTRADINFQLSDNFLINYCERFMEPVIYTQEGDPLLDNIYKDLNKLQTLILKIFEFDFVETIELRFSYIEVDENEYEICETSVDRMKDVILEKYLSDIGFPVVNIVINKHSG